MSKVSAGRGPGVNPKESPPQLSGHGSSTICRGERSEDRERIFHTGESPHLYEGFTPGPL